MPPTVTISPSRRRSSSASAQSVLRRSWSRIAVQRMLGDVEAERLLLEPQQLALLVLVARRSAGGGAALGSGLVAEVEDRALAGEPVGLLRGRPRRAPRRARRACPFRESPVESSAPHLTSDSSARLFTTCGSTRSVKSQIDANGPALLARGDDRARRRVADVLDRVQAEADLALDDREVALGLVHVRRQHLDPHLVAGVHVERHAVLRVHHGRDQRGHVLARVVRAAATRCGRRSARSRRRATC